MSNNACPHELWLVFAARIAARHQVGGKQALAAGVVLFCPLNRIVDRGGMALAPVQPQRNKRRPTNMFVNRNVVRMRVAQKGEAARVAGMGSTEKRASVKVCRRMVAGLMVCR